MHDEIEASRRRFLSIEGCDGAGKSTVSQLVYNSLQRLELASVLVYPKRPRFEDASIDEFMTSLLGTLRGPRHLLTHRQWLSLTSIWYDIIDRHIVRPAVARRQIVIADTWYVKPMARFTLLSQDLRAECTRYFSRLEQPAFTFLLNVEPHTAAARKGTFGFGETGNFEQPRELNRENFIAYQSRIQKELHTMAQAKNWVTIETENVDAACVAKQILHYMNIHGWLTKESDSELH